MGARIQVLQPSSIVPRHIGRELDWKWDSPRLELVPTWVARVKGGSLTCCAPTKHFAYTKQLVTAFSEEFIVREDLMDTAVGKVGKNKQHVRKVPGVTATELEKDTGTWTVCGASSDVVKMPRGFLGYVVDFIRVPRTCWKSNREKWPSCSRNSGQA